MFYVAAGFSLRWTRKLKLAATGRASYLQEFTDLRNKALLKGELPRPVTALPFHIFSLFFYIHLKLWQILLP
jgi:hypothetical protein